MRHSKLTNKRIELIRLYLQLTDKVEEKGTYYLNGVPNVIRITSKGVTNFSNLPQYHERTWDRCSSWEIEQVFMAIQKKIKSTFGIDKEIY